MPLYNPDRGLISVIQKYSTKDGPGIRSTLFLKGCPLGCLWCSNPELIRPQPDLLYTREKCACCGTCINTCPQGALCADAGSYIQIMRERCDGCGECVAACPHGALELAGRLMTVDEAAAELLKDRVFYQTSGGGVTFSGGEPLWQAGFVARVAACLKEESVHTALDTAGDITWCRFEEVLLSIARVLFDIKLTDNDKHRQYTGRDNGLILANAQLLARTGVPMHIRLVLVPGINDSLGEIRARMDFIAQLGESVRQGDMLPYHRYGQGKYARLWLDYPLIGLPEHTDEQVAEMRALVEGYGIPVTVGG